MTSINYGGEKTQLLGFHGEKRTAQFGVIDAYFKPMFNIVCTMAGAGILNMPFNTTQGGWITVMLIFLCALMANYTGKALIKCLYASPDTERLSTYADIGYAAFGTPGRFISQLFQKITLLGIGVIFLILCGLFLSDALPSPDSHDSDYWRKSWIWVAAAVVVIPLLIFKTLKELAVLSFLGMTATFITVLTVIVLSFTDYYGLTPEDSTNTYGSHTFFNSSGIAAAFGSITVAFGGASVCPTIEEHMLVPSNFGAVYNMAFVILMILYVPTVVVGYFVYGDLTQSPILDSLPSSGNAGRAVTAAKLIITFHLLCAYPIVINVVSLELEKILQIDEVYRTPRMAYILRSLLRIFLVFFTATVAYFIPYIADVQAVLGAISLTFMVYILPCAFNLKLRSKNLGVFEKVINILIILIGVAGGGIGSYQAIKGMIDDISQDNSG